MQKPIKSGYITSEFGPRVLNGQRNFHGGIDIGSKDEKPIVFNTMAGRVVACGWSNASDHKASFGLRVWVCVNPKLYICYAHLSEINPDLKIGLAVPEGVQIGIMGNTGHSFGKHLHYEHRTAPNTNGLSVEPKSIRELYYT